LRRTRRISSVLPCLRRCWRDFCSLCALGLGFILLFPLLFTTLHTAYRDIFVGV
jgi:hypothetical protein